MASSSGSKLGVFPAAGGLGGSIVKHLLPLIPADNLILIARNPDKLAAESRAGAVVRKADYDDDASLDRVFDGIGALFLISYASCEHEHRSKVHRKAIDFARRSGVHHIFYSSLAFAGQASNDSTRALVMRAHLETEAYLAELSQTRPGFTYTVLREGLYHESFPIYTAFFDAKKPVDEIRIPHDGSAPGVAWAKREELGEASAKLIAQYARNPPGYPYLNKTLLLSGPTVLTLAEVVRILGRVIGKEDVRIKQVSVDEYAQQAQIAPRLTYHDVDLSTEWATAWEAIRAGECAVVTPTLREVLGREPEDFETTVRQLIKG